MGVGFVRNVRVIVVLPTRPASARKPRFKENRNEVKKRNKTKTKTRKHKDENYTHLNGGEGRPPFRLVGRNVLGL